MRAWKQDNELVRFGGERNPTEAVLFRCDEGDKQNRRGARTNAPERWARKWVWEDKNGQFSEKQGRDIWDWVGFSKTETGRAKWARGQS